MSIKEINSPNCDGAMFPSIDGYNNTIRRANDMLIYRQFDECLLLCREQSASAKNYAEDPNSADALKSFVVIAIQAYAELNRWQEVIPFVTHIYDGLEDCPASVAKLCILLHLRLDDRATCTVVATIWTRNATNFCKSGYQELVGLYIDRVLLPGALWEDARSFLLAVPGLTDAAREASLRKVQTAKSQHQLKTADDIEVLESGVVDTTQPRSRNKSSGGYENVDLSVRCRRYLVQVKSLVRKHVPLSYIFHLRNICVVTALVYVLYSRWYSGRFSLSSPLTDNLRATLRRLWKGMFAPFHDVDR